MLLPKKRERFFRQGKIGTEISWPPRTRSVGEIKAEISARFDKRFSKYGNSVRNVTKSCTAYHSRKRAWVECNKILELRQELERALAMAAIDKKRNQAYMSLDALEIVPSSNLLLTKFSQWSRVSQSDLEIWWIMSRVIGLQLVIALLTHLVLTPDDQNKRAGRKTPRLNRKKKLSHFRKHSTNNIVPFERKLSAKRHIECFLSDCTTKKRGASAGATQLYKAFVRYQRARNLPTYTQRLFGGILGDLRYKKGPYGDLRRTHYFGIQLQDEAAPARNLSRNL